MITVETNSKINVGSKEALAGIALVGLVGILATFIITSDLK